MATEQPPSVALESARGVLLELKGALSKVLTDEYMRSSGIGAIVAHVGKIVDDLGRAAALRYGTAPVVEGWLVEEFRRRLREFKFMGGTMGRVTMHSLDAATLAEELVECIDPEDAPNA